MTKEPLSKIQDTITGHTDFMIELAQQAGVDDAINDCVQQLKDLNREGMYEDFMRGKWSDLRWWMAAAINYNNMTLDRIRTGKFHTGQLEKIEKNTLQKSKTPKAKADLVNRWGDYCTRESLDPYIFEMARINGIDYDA